jgi:hypothetical protein
VIYLTDGLRDMLLTSKSKDIALKSESCWKMMGEKPFLDEAWEAAQ